MKIKVVVIINNASVILKKLQINSLPLGWLKDIGQIFLSGRYR